MTEMGRRLCPRRSPTAPGEVVCRRGIINGGRVEGSEEMAKLSGLTVRQHEREAVELPVEFVVSEAHREQVRFSAICTAPEPHLTRGIAVDMSPGGMGLVCEQYVPRMCGGMVRVFDPDPIGTGPDGSPVREVVFEHEVKVRRVSLRSHDPTYALGVAFVDPEPDIEQRVAKLLALAQGLGDSGRDEGDEDV